MTQNLSVPFSKEKGLATVTGGQGHVVSSESFADAIKGFTVTVVSLALCCVEQAVFLS